ncbi:unnamed protein product [Ambrosiozyma monospora]|uniref:Unnamed protein product n=1 Tax=Ambrosiozyma monospora TaxID=43982 RepID=A0ACB5TT61_AMBMO|nr:unnamed protein product [Ambrosiozyma monospora]
MRIGEGSPISDIVNGILRGLPSEIIILLLSETIIDYFDSTTDEYPYWDGKVQDELADSIERNSNFDDAILCPVLQKMKLKTSNLNELQFSKLSNFIFKKSIKIKEMYLGNYFLAHEVPTFDYEVLKMMEFGCQEVVIERLGYDLHKKMSHVKYLTSVSFCWNRWVESTPQERYVFLIK